MASPKDTDDDGDGEESVILILDNQTKNSLENSVELVESSEGIPSVEGQADGTVDEECEVVVTFCKRPKLMLHARYDCTTFPFVRAECETTSPLGRNAETCGECYCYICNTPAVECKDWATPSLCHCNAHHKSQYWKDQWNFALTGGLATFDLKLSEIDADVKKGGALLQKFMHDISVEYSRYLMGERVFLDCQECFCHLELGPRQCRSLGLHSQLVYRYTSVAELVAGFLDQAGKEAPKAEAIVLLGLAREIALHKDPAAYSQSVHPSATLSMAVKGLMGRITRQLQRLLILHDFPKALHDKLVYFYRSIPFPVHCYAFMESLDFLPWDHSLLTSVLKGQNVTGRRLQKRKKEKLLETLPVIEARVERMEADNRYKELVRYLKVLKGFDVHGIQEQRDKFPFYLCKTGELEEAAQALFTTYSRSCCTACRLSPAQFEVYLKIFQTGEVPPGKAPKDAATPWPSLGTPLKLRSLIKWTMKLLYRSSTLYKNPKCWSAVIRTFSSRPFLGANGCLIAATLEEPPQDFQQMVLATSSDILDHLAANIPQNFPLSDAFAGKRHLEARLIFATQAVREMVLKECRALNGFLEIILAFGNNLWALKLLLASLSPHAKVLGTILALTVDDLQCREAEMLELWQSRGPQYVGELLCLFLMSSHANAQSVGLAILRILQANLERCRWAKQVGQFLENPENLPCGLSPEFSSFVAAARTLP